LPFFIAKFGIDREGELVIYVNLHSLRIPEILIQKHIKDAYDVRPEYLRCVKRICGVFSKIVTDRKISKKVVEQTKTELNENIYIHCLSYREVCEIRNGIKPLKYFKKTRGRARRKIRTPKKNC